MSELIYGLLRLSFSAVPVILAVMAGRIILSFAPKKYSYALWSVVAFRLCVPFSFKSHFSFRALGQSIVALFEKGSEVQNITPSLPPLTESVTELVPPAPAVTAPAVDSMGIAETLPVMENTSRAVSFSDILPTLLAALWIVGIAVFLILGVVSYVKLKRSVADAIHTEGRIYVHRDVTSPFVIGILKPRILLPEGLDEATAEAVLAHENCHIRRGDHIIKTVAFLILSFHWFNPFCYLAFFLMSRDMEMSCDEKVLASMDHPDKRKEYSMAILKTATRNKSIVSTVSFGAVGIKKRIKRTLDYKKPSLLVTALSLILCTVILFGCAANAPEKATKNNESTNVTPTPESELTPLDDAVTRAYLAYLVEEDHALGVREGSYLAVAHKTFKTYENEAEGTVSVMSKMPSQHVYNPVTGEQDSCLCIGDIMLMKFKKEGNVYEKLNCISVEGYDITDELVAEYFPKENTEEIKQLVIDVYHGKYFSEAIASPYRYEKDGKLFVVDNSQRYKYFDSLIAEILTSHENYDDPEGYITENAETFKQLCKERDIEKFLLSEFFKGGNDDLRGFVMYRTLEEFLAEGLISYSQFEEPFEYTPENNNGQEYFDAWLDAVLKLVAEEGYFSLYRSTRIMWKKLYETYTEKLSDKEFASLGYVYDLPDKITVCHGEKSLVLDNDDEAYYKLFRESTYVFFNPAMMDEKTVKQYEDVNGKDDYIIKHYLGYKADGSNMITAEFSYDDGSPTVVFGGEFMVIEEADYREVMDNGNKFVLIEKDSGKYELYAQRSAPGTLSKYLYELLESN